MHGRTLRERRQTTTEQGRQSLQAASYRRCMAPYNYRRLGVVDRPMYPKEHTQLLCFGDTSCTRDQHVE